MIEVIEEWEFGPDGMEVVFVGGEGGPGREREGMREREREIGRERVRMRER